MNGDELVRCVWCGRAVVSYALEMVAGKGYCPVCVPAARKEAARRERDRQGLLAEQAEQAERVQQAVARKRREEKYQQKVAQNRVDAYCRELKAAARREEERREWLAKCTLAQGRCPQCGGDLMLVEEGGGGWAFAIGPL